MINAEDLPERPTTPEGYWLLMKQLTTSFHAFRQFMDDSDIARNYEIGDILATELEEKFGIIHPKDSPQPDENGEYPKPPEGKEWYWSWYQKMRDQMRTQVEVEYL